MDGRQHTAARPSAVKVVVQPLGGVALLRHTTIALVQGHKPLLVRDACRLVQLYEPGIDAEHIKYLMRDTNDFNQFHLHTKPYIMCKCVNNAIR